MKSTFLIYLLTIFAISGLSAQEKTIRLSLDDVFSLSLVSSAARIVKMNYQNELLQYENYKKSFLPAISFAFTPLSFNRSLRLLQNPENGSYSSIEDYSNTSSGAISVSQKIGPVGGNLNISSSLNYLNEFSSKRNSFSTSPFLISYSQQLWGGRKLYLFEKKIQDTNNQIAIKEYCSKLAEVQTPAFSLFFDVLFFQLEENLAFNNLQVNDSLLYIAKRKLNNGYITEYDYKHIELQLLDLRYTHQKAQKQHNKAMQDLQTYLDMGEDSLTVVLPEFRLPLIINREEVEFYVKQNNPLLSEYQVNRLKAEKELFSARMETWFNGSLSLNYGTNQFAETFISAYRHANEQQSVMIGLQIPVYQWGINRNKRKIAHNNYQKRNLEIENNIRKYKNEIKERTDSYNHSVRLWQLSEKSYRLSQEQYTMAIRSFELGHISVYELVDALKKQHDALSQYFAAIKETYTAYFLLRNVALYDFEKKKNLEEIFI